MPSLTLPEVMGILMNKIKEAQDDKNNDECLRLAQLGIDIFHEYIDKVKLYIESENRLPTEHEE